MTFYCSCCEFETIDKFNYNRHTSTQKHLKKIDLKSKENHKNKLEQLNTEFNERTKIPRLIYELKNLKITPKILPTNKYNNLCITGNWFVDGRNRECKICSCKGKNEYDWYLHTNTETHIQSYNFIKSTINEYDNIIKNLHSEYKELLEAN
jgi:hypothetical protein